jgi:hypothetical protein
MAIKKELILQPFHNIKNTEYFLTLWLLLCLLGGNEVSSHKLVDEVAKVYMGLTYQR